MLIASMEGPGTLDNVARLRGVFHMPVCNQPDARQALEDLELAFAEIAANAVRHASRKPNTMAVSLHLEGGVFRADLTDDGAPFRGFRNAWQASSVAPMDLEAESGRGLWLARQATDSLTYDHRNGNRWTMRRAIRRSEHPAILLIEDEDATRGLYTALLARIGDVTAAGSIAEAAEALERARFDLIVADFNLGDGQTASLLDGRADLDAPVIFITADTSGIARDSGLRHGVHTVLQKPVRPLDLKERAAEALAAHRGAMMRAGRRFAQDVSPLIAATEPLVARECRIAARGATASTGGGDAFFDLGDNGARRRFALVDCVGHGMPARIQAGLMAGLLAGQPRDQWRGPSAALDALSRAMVESPVAEGVIATVVAIDLMDDGTIEIASGGHPAPLVVTQDGIRQLPLHGALPGLMPRCGAETARLNLARGERLFIATDGLAPRSSDLLDGLPEAVSTALRETATKPVAVALDRLETAIAGALGAQPADDWTFVLIEAA